MRLAPLLRAPVLCAAVPGVLAVGCAAAPPPPVPVLAAPVAAPPRVVARPVAVSASVAGVTPGVWTYAQDARGSIAMFGTAGSGAQLTLRCAARRVFLSVPGSSPAQLTLRATSTARTVAAVPSATGYIAVELSPTDPILDALAYSRGRFTVTGGMTTLTLPTWPQFARVVEDCRG